MYSNVVQPLADAISTWIITKNRQQFRDYFLWLLRFLRKLNIFQQLHTTQSTCAIETVSCLLTKEMKSQCTNFMLLLECVTRCWKSCLAKWMANNTMASYAESSSVENMLLSTCTRQKHHVMWLFTWHWDFPSISESNTGQIQRLLSDYSLFTFKIWLFIFPSLHLIWFWQNLIANLIWNELK